MPLAYSKEEFYELEKEESFNKNILIEGDSWISHPLVPNLARQIESLGKNGFNVLNLGAPGDTVLGVLNRHAGQYKLLKELISDPQFGTKFDMIFLSAAGNDIIGRGNDREPCFYADGDYAYRELFRSHLDPEQVHQIREALDQELVLGRDDFKVKIKQKTQRQT